MKEEKRGPTAERGAESGDREQAPTREKAPTQPPAASLASRGPPLAGGVHERIGSLARVGTTAEVVLYRDEAEAARWQHDL